MKRRIKLLSDFLKKWNDRKNKYPWVLTFGIFLVFFSSLLIGLIQGLKENYVLNGFNFVFANNFSLILWFPIAFLIGFLKNRNLSRNKESRGGTSVRAFIYGLTLFISVLVLYWVLSELFPNPALDLAFSTTTDIRYGFAWLSVIASILGAFISITLRGSLYDNFFPTID